MRQRLGRCAPAGVGAALVVVVALVDVILERSAIFIPLLVAGPLAAAVRAGVRCTAGVGVLALVAAIGLGSVDGVVFDGQHNIEVLTVLAGALLATAGASARARFEAALETERIAHRRAEYLSRLSDLLDTPLDPDVRLQRLVAVAVPTIADLCVVDFVEPDGRLRTVAVAGADPAVADAVRGMRERTLIDPGGPHPVAVAARTGEPQLVEDLGEERRRRIAGSDEELRVMREARYRSGMAVPLIARGRTLGVLSFLRLGEARPYDRGDLAVAVDAARRAAMGLDNARLFAELTRTERQLEAVLANLADAVTVQARDFSLVYVNRAAAELFECSSPEEVLSTPLREILGRFVALDEDGNPLDFADLPGRYALAGDAAPEPMLVRSISRATGRERWILVKASPVHDEDGDVALAVNIMEDVTEVRRAAQHQRFLAAASKLVSASLDVGATLDRVAWAVVPELADWCIVDMPDERGVIRPVAIAHVDPAGRELLAEMRERYPPPDDDRNPVGVMRHGRSQLFSDLDPELVERYARDERHLEIMRALATRSVAVVPLSAGDRVIGTLTVATAQSQRRLAAEEVALLEEVGRRAGIAVENARLHQTRTEIATTLQRSLLPPRLPIVPGLTIAARFRAAGETTEVGGDFYDLFPVDGGWMVVIGDVTGKGPLAATITSLARYTMRTAAVYEPAPARVLGRLNAALADTDRRQLCTAVCARVAVDPDGTVEVTVASGGHPPPYLLRDGRADVVPTRGPLLGAFENARWREVDLRLQPGDSLVLYTDGVTDTRGEDGTFGDERLAQVLAEAGGLEPDEVATRVDEALLAFERGAQRDDVALLVLRAAESFESAASLMAAAARSAS